MTSIQLHYIHTHTHLEYKIKSHGTASAHTNTHIDAQIHIISLSDFCIRAKNRGLDVSIDIDKRTPIDVKGDAVKLRQVREGNKRSFFSCKHQFYNADIKCMFCFCLNTVFCIDTYERRYEKKDTLTYFFSSDPFIVHALLF